jgi:hypothetical protein
MYLHNVCLYKYVCLYKCIDTCMSLRKHHMVLKTSYVSLCLRIIELYRINIYVYIQISLSIYLQNIRLKSIYLQNVRLNACFCNYVTWYSCICVYVYPFIIYTTNCFLIFATLENHGRTHPILFFIFINT